MKLYITENTFGLCAECSNERARAYQKANPNAVYRRGDFVKLAFKHPLGKLPVEHMWVIVKGRRGGVYWGVLDNDPNNLTHIKCGDRVNFTTEQVEQKFEI